MQQKSSWFARYLLPGCVFQSIVLAGGYGTGRELVEFFLSIGPKNGLIGMCVAALIWSVVSALSFEFARRFQAYEYRKFFQTLLGRGWVLFEYAYIALLMIVLSIIAASAGSTLENTLNIPYNYGVVGLILYVAFMAFRGSQAIATMLSFWSFVLYGVYIVFFTYCMDMHGEQAMATISHAPADGAWFHAGLTYACYNMGLIPAALFALRSIQTKKEAYTAGFLAGWITITPGILFFIAMAGAYPVILDATVPSVYLLDQLNKPWLTVAYNIVLFGTLIETGIGLIHSINERIAGQMAQQNKTLPAYFRPALALGLLVCAAMIAQLGLVALIAKGYGTITWVILAVYVLPIITLGVYRMQRQSPRVAI